MPTTQALISAIAQYERMGFNCDAIVFDLARGDARGQGVACGKSFIPKGKKCSKDKAATTPKEALKRTAEKQKARQKLRAEVEGRTVKIKKKVNDPRKKEVENLGSWSDMELERTRKYTESEKDKAWSKFIDPSTPKDQAFKYGMLHRALQHDLDQITSEQSHRVTTSKVKAQAKLEKRRKENEQKAWNKAKKTVNESSKERVSKDPVSASLDVVKDPNIRANLRRRLEPKIEGNRLSEKDFNSAFNAVGGSSDFKDKVKTSLQKSGIKIYKPEMTDQERRYAEASARREARAAETRRRIAEEESKKKLA